MRRLTHQLVAGSVVLVGAHIVSAPNDVAAVAGLSSTAAAMLPDRLEFKGFFEHRKTTHSLPFAVAVTVVLWWLGALGSGMGAGAWPLVVAAGFAAGFWLHLAADACTLTGCPGWPVCRTWWLLPRPFRVRTLLGSHAGTGELFFRAVWVGVMGMLVVATS